MTTILDWLVQYRTTSGPGVWTTFIDPVTPSTGAIVTGLTEGVSYDFRVAGINVDGTGGTSNVVTGYSQPGVSGAQSTSTTTADVGGVSPTTQVVPVGCTSGTQSRVCGIDARPLRTKKPIKHREAGVIGAST